MPVPPPPNARRIHHGRVMDFWEWDQTQFDRSSEIFECITRPDTVAVIPFLDSTTVLLTKQHQPHKIEPFFDVPGGRVDTGESLEAAVRRELTEETGNAADEFMEWHRLASKGMARFEEALYICKGVRDGFPRHNEPGEKIELLPTKWDDLVRMCLKRQLRQPNIMLAILQMEYDPESKKRLAVWLAQ